jgi:hypothetical protein
MAFRLKGLTGVTLPEGLESIGSQAFFGNQLSIVEIPLSVKSISASAFDSNMLRKVTQVKKPAVTGTSYTADRNGETKAAHTTGSSEKIYYISAEKQNENITGSVKSKLIQPPVNKSNERYNPLAGYDSSYKPVSVAPGSKRTGTLLNNDGKTPVSLSTDSKIPAANIVTANSGVTENPVKYLPEAADTADDSKYSTFNATAEFNVKLNSASGIGKNAYRNMGLDSITIPEGTKFIGESAFFSNNLTYVKIPESVRQIGSQAFMGNNLTSVTIGENVIMQYDSFRYQFSDYYRMNNYKAGTYHLKAGHWNFEGREPEYKSVTPY